MNERDNGTNGLGCAVVCLLAILLLALIAYAELTTDDFFYQDSSLYENTCDLPLSIKKFFKP